MDALGRRASTVLAPTGGGPHEERQATEPAAAEESSADATPPFDGVVAVTETGLPGMLTRGMAGQPMEPDSVDAVDPNDG